MRLPVIWTLIKKELKDIFRDKKTIFAMIILPVLMYPVLMVGMGQVMALIEGGIKDSAQVVSIAPDVPNKLVNLLKADETLQFIEVEDYEVALKEEAIQVYIDYDAQAEKPFSLHYDAANDRSNQTKNAVKDVFETYEEQLIEERIEAAGLVPEVLLAPVTIDFENHAKEEQMAGYFLAAILPMILLVTIASAATYPSIDVMAGEKERGTIETLLTLPVSNTELIMGKFIAVATMALMSALLNLASLAASVALMLVSMGITTEMLGDVTIQIQWGEFVVPMLITVITVCLFTLVIVAISMSICALAKTFKEAQNYITPLLIVVFFPAYTTMIPGLELTPTTASIPMVNIALLIKSVLMFEYDLGLMGIVLLSNLGLMILTIFVLVRLFDSENILFGSGREFALLQRRYNIPKGTIPTFSDALFIFAIALLALIYIGQILQLRFGFAGIGMTQGVLFLLVILFAWYMKTDVKRTFSLKVPSIKQVVGSLFIWLGTFCIVLVVSSLLMPLSTSNEETVEALSTMLTHDNLWVNLCVVAVLPAICEEVLFRGLIFKGLENGGHKRRAILGSALLFGLMHMDFIRIPTTAILGIALAYVVCKTGSLYLAMLIHCVNNGVAVLMERVPATWMQALDEQMVRIPTNIQYVLCLVIGGILIAIGCLCVRTKQTKKQGEPLEKTDEAL